MEDGMVQLILLERDGTVYTDRVVGSIKDYLEMKAFTRYGNTYEIRAAEPSTKTVVGFAQPRVRTFSKTVDNDDLDYWLREIINVSGGRITSVHALNTESDRQFTINYEVKT